MTQSSQTVRQCESQIERALWSLEVNGKVEEALAVYRDAEATLQALEVTGDQPVYAEQQRVLAYCLMRQGNALRQLGRSEEALTVSEREVAAARASGDDVALARSLMSNGANRIVAGEVERGMEMLEEARVLFERGDSTDHRQGLGWSWILQADLVNAKLITQEQSAAIEAADLALALLLPIENWAGVARAYAARAQAHESLGDSAAAADRKAQKRYESLVESEEGQ
jgi:tetratricopeptide (TPR) repeat protein